MSEPASSTVGAMAGWKLIGGLAGLAAGGAGLAALVVMCMTPPRTHKEWVVGIVSTVIGSVSGGASIVQYFNLQHWADNPFGLMSMIGLCFACGLPAWAIVRWLFNYINKRSMVGLDEIAAEVRKSIAGQP